MVSGKRLYVLDILMMLSRFVWALTMDARSMLVHIGTSSAVLSCHLSASARQTLPNVVVDYVLTVREHILVAHCILSEEANRLESLAIISVHGSSGTWVVHHDLVRVYHLGHRGRDMLVVLLAEVIVGDHMAIETVLEKVPNRKFAIVHR